MVTFHLKKINQLINQANISMIKWLGATARIAASSMLAVPVFSIEP
jgi:hypothetical protein